MDTLDINSSIFSVMYLTWHSTDTWLTCFCCGLGYISTKWARSWEPYVWNWAKSRQIIECSDLPAENGQNVRDGALVVGKMLEHLNIHHEGKGCW